LNLHTVNCSAAYVAKLIPVLPECSGTLLYHTALKISKHEFKCRRTHGIRG